MTGKAHTALGVGTALGACELMGCVGGSDLSKVGLCVVVAATAATLPDIDVGAAKKVYRYSIMGLLAALVAAVLFAVLKHGSVGEIPLTLVGLVIVCGLSIFGKNQPHRGFTHSFTALAAYAVGVVLCTGGMAMKYRRVVVIAFVIAYLSHILIDLLNKKGEQLFYPMPKRYCFKVCTASGVGNEATCLAGAFLTVVLLGNLFI